MSGLSFTNTPLQKLLNKRNIFSRVDALEAKDEQPSLTADTLGEITPDAGDIYVTEITNVITNEVIGGDFYGPASAVSDNFVSFDGISGKRGKDSGKKAADFAASAHVTTHLHGGSDNLITISAVEPTAPAGGYFWVDTA